MPSKPRQTFISCSILLVAIASQGQDLHIKKSILVGGNFTSSAETSIKGARERTVSQGASGTTITLRQCDLRRTLTLNDQTQSYLVVDDPQDENAAKAAALATGTSAQEATGGRIIVTTSVTLMPFSVSARATPSHTATIASSTSAAASTLPMNASGKNVSRTRRTFGRSGGISSGKRTMS